VGPLDVVKIRFQVQLEPISLHTAMTKRPPHYHGFLHAFRTIVAEEGIKVRMPSAAGAATQEIMLWRFCSGIALACLSGSQPGYHNQQLWQGQRSAQQLLLHVCCALGSVTPQRSTEIWQVTCPTV
jgi:hypothetical protein